MSSNEHDNDPSPEQMAEDAIVLRSEERETPQMRAKTLTNMIDLMRVHDGEAAVVSVLYDAMLTNEFEHLLRAHLNAVNERIRDVTGSEYWGDVKALRSSSDPMIWRVEISTGKSYISTRGERLYATRDQALTLWYAEQENKLPALIEGPPTVNADPLPL